MLRWVNEAEKKAELTTMQVEDVINRSVTVVVMSLSEALRSPEVIAPRENNENSKHSFVSH